MQVRAVRSMPRWIIGLTGLFAVQFFMCSLSVFPEQNFPLWLERAIVASNARPLVYGAIPSAMFAYFLSRMIRASERSSGFVLLPSRAVALSWAVVWLSCWLLLYVLFAGPNIAAWSTSPLVQPISWLSFVLCALGLLLGSRTEGEA